jgi:hypothetical protein
MDREPIGDLALLVLAIAGATIEADGPHLSAVRT